MIKKPILTKLKKQYLCFYDIENNSKRGKMAKFLKKFGLRLQKSVFIVFLEKKEKKGIIHYFNKIKEKDDKIGIIHLCDNCYRKIEHIPKFKFKSFYIV